MSECKHEWQEVHCNIKVCRKCYQTKGLDPCPDCAKNTAITLELMERIDVLRKGLEEITTHVNQFGSMSRAAETAEDALRRADAVGTERGNQA